MQQEPWSVLHVNANHEKKVVEHLTVRSIENYLPLYSERSRWSDRSVMVHRPLFAGYVFVRFTASGRLAVLSTPGVIRVLGGPGSGVILPEEIDRIREGLKAGCLLRPHPQIAVGTQVRVRSGIFAGLEGVVAELRQQCRVVLCVAAIQQCYSLEISLDEIEVLRSGHASRPVMGSVVDLKLPRRLPRL